MGNGNRIFVILWDVYILYKESLPSIYFNWNLNMAQGNVIVCQVDDGGLSIVNPVGYIDCI